MLAPNLHSFPKAQSATDAKHKTIWKVNSSKMKMVQKRCRLEDHHIWNKIKQNKVFTEKPVIFVEMIQCNYVTQHTTNEHK